MSDKYHFSGKNRPVMDFGIPVQIDGYNPYKIGNMTILWIKIDKKLQLSSLFLLQNRADLCTITIELAILTKFCIE